MIPEFDSEGNLPPGIHWAVWKEIVTRFGITVHRSRLLAGLRRALPQFKAAKSRSLYLDGSFVTKKKHPNDYDVCYDVVGADPAALDPIFLDFADFGLARRKQKLKYYGEFFPAQAGESGTGQTFLEFFQQDKNTGAPKGIVGLDLRGWQDG
jgi:hypothetical protein